MSSTDTNRSIDVLHSTDSINYSICRFHVCHRMVLISTTDSSYTTEYRRLEARHLSGSPMISVTRIDSTFCI